MKSVLAFIALTLSMAFAPAIEQRSAEGKAVPIFDGKSFAGWEGNLAVFRIEGGAIVGGSLKEKIHAGPPSEAWYKDITLLDLTAREPRR